MSFPLSTVPILPWRDVDVLRPVTEGLAVVSLASIEFSALEGATAVMFSIALSWISAVVLAALWCAYSFTQHSFQVLWPIRFLRFGARATATGLFIPLL